MQYLERTYDAISIGVEEMEELGVMEIHGLQ